VASLAGGWLENFAVCHRLPQAIAEHGIGRFVGRRVLRWASEAFARNISGFGISTALGVMLGMIPVFGIFFGLPLDLRHVTLSTGQLAFALSSLGPEALGRPDTLSAVVGIGIIFSLNLGVSFFLALAVALRAREVPRRDRWSLFSVIARHFVRHPLQFLLPPRTPKS
jgi:site-specific recombinase